MSANDEQVGGSHYKRRKIQHWDYAAQLPYLDGQVSKYIDRHEEKGGFQDLLKAQHYLTKMMEHYYPEEYKAHMAAQIKLAPVEVWPGHTLHDLNKLNEQYFGEDAKADQIAQAVSSMIKKPRKERKDKGAKKRKKKAARK